MTVHRPAALDRINQALGVPESPHINGNCVVHLCRGRDINNPGFNVGVFYIEDGPGARVRIARITSKHGAKEYPFSVGYMTTADLGNVLEAIRVGIVVGQQEALFAAVEDEANVACADALDDDVF